MIAKIKTQFSKMISCYFAVVSAGFGWLAQYLEITLLFFLCFYLLLYIINITLYLFYVVEINYYYVLSYRTIHRLGVADVILAQ